MGLDRSKLVFMFQGFVKGNPCGKGKINIQVKGGDCSGTRWRLAPFLLFIGLSFLFHAGAEQDADLVEHQQGKGNGHLAHHVGAGGDAACHDEDDDDRVLAYFFQVGGRYNADLGQEEQHQRQLEGEAAAQHQRQDHINVAVGGPDIFDDLVQVEIVKKVKG